MDKNKIKKLFAFALVFTSFFASAISGIALKSANAVIVDQVIAVVDKTPVTLYDFAKFNRVAFENYEQVQEQASRGVFTAADARVLSNAKAVVNLLIDKILIKREEEKAAIYIPDKELNLYIHDVAHANNFTAAQFFNFLKKRGISKSAYIKHIRDHFTEINLLRKVYGNKMVITKQDLIGYYRKNIEEFRGRPMADLKLIFIGVPPGASKQQTEKTYKLMEKIRNTAISGSKSFSSLARKYSEDASEKNGGRIGYVFRDKLSPAFSKYAFRLKVGEVSKIIKSKFGYTIIKSVGKKVGAFKTFKQVKPQIFSILEKYKTEKYLGKLLKKARKDAYIKILIPV